MSNKLTRLNSALLIVTRTDGEKQSRFLVDRAEAGKADAQMIDAEGAVTFQAIDQLGLPQTVTFRRDLIAYLSTHTFTPEEFTIATAGFEGNKKKSAPKGDKRC